jgi:Domain of unknown function (DUF3883)
MRWLKSRPWNSDPDFAEVSEEVEWNLWQTRQTPFADLEDGDRVFLASPDGDGVRVITWEVEVTKNVKVKYASKRDAWRTLVSTFPSLRDRPGTSQARFLGEDYTQGAAEAGYLLAWSSSPIRRIDRPRPKELRFRPNGWLGLDDFAEADLKRWGVAGSRSQIQQADRRRPPRSTDPLKRVAVERRAMVVAKSELRRLGWAAADIYDTSANRPYDFECRNGSSTVRVEVKGLSGPLSAVALTRGEVEHARTSAVAMILVVVHGIDLKPDGARFKGHGGTAVTWHPWEIDTGTLAPSAFDYALPPPPV